MKAEQIFAQAEEQLQALCTAEAIVLFQDAERAGYDADSCAGERWFCHMLSGNFELAWRESDAIASRGKPDPNAFWDGHPLSGRRVLLRCLHGLGDTIQFIRYAPLIRRQARTFAIEAQPELKRLLTESRIADQVLTWGDPEPAWDQQIEVVELPRIFRTTLESVPAEVPYLDVPARRARNRGNAAMRIGFVWSPSNYNRSRGIPIQTFAPLFDTPGTAFFSLQAGPAASELERWNGQIESLYDQSACIYATAQALKTLDLVITVDTMVAHLAGAMALPVWTLLPYQCDWRWMLHRSDSPWYPTMRLFRQQRPADWPSVIQQVDQELRQLVASTAALHPARRVAHCSAETSAPEP